MEAERTKKRGERRRGTEREEEEEWRESESVCVCKRETDRQAGRPTGRQTDRQTDRTTNRELRSKEGPRNRKERTGKQSSRARGGWPEVTRRRALLSD